MTSLRALRATAAIDLRFQQRHGIAAAVAVVTLVWILLLRLVPAEQRTLLLPLAVYGDVGVVGLVFVGGHVLMERRDRVLAALGTSPLPPAGYVAGKVVTLTSLAVAASAALVVGTGSAHPAAPVTVVPAVVLLSVICLATGLIVVAHVHDVTGYLFAVQAPLAPVLLPLLERPGWVPRVVGDLVPTAGPLHLVEAAVRGHAPDAATWAGLAYAAVVAALLVRAAIRSTAGRLLPAFDGSGSRRTASTSRHAAIRPTTRPERISAGRGTGRARPWPAVQPVAGLLRGDLRGAVRDPVVPALVAGPVAMALVARGSVPIAARAAADAGWDLHMFRPTMLALLLIVTAMLFGAVAGLLDLEERDDGTLRALLLTPLPRVVALGRRAVTATVCTGVALLVAVPLSGLSDHPLPLAAMAVATMVSPVFALALPGLARDRLEALAVMKVVTLPALAPLAAPWLDGAPAALLRLVPTWWVVAAIDAGGPGAWAAGVAVLALLALVLYRLTVRRLGAST